MTFYNLYHQLKVLNLNSSKKHQKKYYFQNQSLQQSSSLISESMIYNTEIYNAKHIFGDIFKTVRH